MMRFLIQPTWLHRRVLPLCVVWIAGCGVASCAAEPGSKVPTEAEAESSEPHALPRKNLMELPEPRLPLPIVFTPGDEPRQHSTDGLRIGARRALCPRQHDQMGSGLETSARTAQPAPAVAWKLAGVLGVFLLGVWCLRWLRARRRPQSALFRVLGQVPVLGRQNAHLVSFGSKILVLVPTANGIEKLTELTDPQEVDRVTEICCGGATTHTIGDLNHTLQCGHRFAVDFGTPTEPSPPSAGERAG